MPDVQPIDWIELLDHELDMNRVLTFVRSPAAGGIDLFLGVTRAEKNVAGDSLVSLDYEAFEEMALKRFKEMAAEARQRWPIERLAILHRLGSVGVAEASVIIAVASPHRAQAFEACRWLIDTLKIDVPIWKKEVWASGEATWSGVKGAGVRERGSQ